MAENVVSILLRVRGAEQVQRTMQQTQQQVHATARAIEQDSGAAMAKQAAIATALTAAIVGVGRESLKAYSGFRRMEIGLQAVTGQSRGAQLAKEIQAIGLASTFTTEEVGRMGQMMLAMGTSEDKLIPRLKSTMNLVAGIAGGTAEFSRAAVQLAQIQSLGQVTGQDIRALSQSFPIQSIAKAAGVKSPMQLSGMSADKFFAAMEKASAAQGDMQAQILEADPFARLRNSVEAFQVALQPTGKILNSMVQKGIAVVEWLGKWFKLINGSGVPVFVAMILVTRYIVRTLWAMHKALWAAIAGLGKLGAMGMAGGAGAAAAGTGMAAKVAASTAGGAGGGATGKAAGNWLSKKVGAKIAGSAAAKLAGGAAANAIPVLGQVIGAALWGWTAWEVASALMSGGGSNHEPNEPVRRPHQRSDIENMQQRYQFGY